MIVGNPLYRNQAQKLASPGQGRQLTFTCLQDASTRTGETYNMPEQPCAAGIMSNVRFPTCWDGVNLDTPNHQDHVAYPTSGTFESNGPCPSTHPVKIPQLFYEVIWDTTPFNDKSLWPTDGSQPFVWSYGDPSGFGTHGDYMFGWQGTSLQDAMKANCYVNCPTLQSQSIQQANQCTKPVVVQENIDGWLPALPGNNPVSGTNPSTSIAASIAGPAATVGAGV
ncbi:MAG: hypothetical protein M1820_005852 [Bogoriella megaspora]|nr:MAG: hypothetical protein M1820_005852 [Bogoriella megaspora]